MAEALRLADALTQPTYPDWVMHIPVPWHPPAQETREAAAELRRLHKENELLASAADKLRMVWRDEVHCLMQDKRQLIAQRDALLEALKEVLAWGTDQNYVRAKAACDKARAAIKAVKENT